MLLTFKIFLAVLAGVLSHVLVFIRGEYHLQAPKIFLLFFLLSVGLLFSQSSHGNDLRSAVGNTISIGTSYLFALFTSIIVYRIFFHKLRRFPGPFFAKVSKLWHVIQLLRKPNFRLLDELHDFYGDFVRIGKNPQICGGACALIYESRSK